MFFFFTFTIICLNYSIRSPRQIWYMIQCCGIFFQEKYLIVMSFSGVKCQTSQTGKIHICYSVTFIKYLVLDF